MHLNEVDVSSFLQSRTRFGRQHLHCTVELLLSASKHTAAPIHDLVAMEKSLKSVIEMIDRLLGYVKQVINGEIEGNERIGKYLLDTLSETSEGAGVEKGQLDTLFNSHLQASVHRSHCTPQS